MSPPLTTLAQRTLPTTATLPPSACCPTLDLAALPSPLPSTSTAPTPTPPTAGSSKLSLYRTTGQADLVWDWTPRPLGGAAAPPAPVPGRPAFLNKGKAKATGAEVGTIQAIAWNPQGSHLAVAVSSPSPSTPASIHLLTLDTGLSPIPPASLPSSSTNGARITHLSWHPLYHARDPLLSSHAASLIVKLPALPTVSKEAATLPGAGAGGPGGVGGGGGPMGGGGGGGVFGAKNAMLQREREKEAGRPLAMEVSGKAWPALLPTELDLDVNSSRKSDGRTGTTATVLVVGDDRGQVHLFLGGSVFLGSFALGGTGAASVAAVQVLPSGPSSTSSRFAVILSTTSSLSLRTLSLNLPPSLEVFTLQSTLLRQHVQHAFESLQEVRTLWDESRRIGKAWLGRLGELSRSHGVTHPPSTQLLLLLMTGRPSRSLHDFLASKMNERGLTKWETTTGQVLEKLRSVTYMSVQPSLERVVLLLDEMRAWGKWPEKFAPFALPSDSSDQSWLTDAVSLATHCIRVSAQVERLALEEERCYVAFCHWLHYELEKVAQQEGSEIRPTAKFQPIPVAHYIRHCLPPLIPPTTTPRDDDLNPYLFFGGLHDPLLLNPGIEACEDWLAAGGGKDPDYDDNVVEKESFGALLKRMKEELRGQLDRTLYTPAAATTAPLATPERPPAPTEPTLVEPKSLPVMLHLLASRLSVGLEESIRSVGEGGTKVEEQRVELGTIEGGGKLGVRSRVVEGGEVWAAWVGAGEKTFCVARQAFSSEYSGVVSNETASYDLTTSDAILSVIDFDFFDDAELLLLLKHTPISSSSTPTYTLSALSLSSPSSQLLPLSRSHTLDPHYPPEALALNGREGRRTACVLSGEGRRLDVLDADEGDEEEEDEADVSMEG